ncbi:MAG: hypothetical protein L7F78_22490 [Syntrophales bacterium LBB04]|nr:hypothetical protein [Syntrophales bacterium LBB04]
MNSCAFDIVHVKQVPTSLESSNVQEASFELEKEVTVSLGTGYDRTLKARTKWDYVGKISYGDVFRTKDQVLTVEASNIHEAYVVISAGKLVGFYLPVENTFSPLSTPTELKVRRAESK